MVGVVFEGAEVFGTWIDELHNYKVQITCISQRADSFRMLPGEVQGAVSLAVLCFALHMVDSGCRPSVAESRKQAHGCWSQCETKGHLDSS